MMQRNGSKVIIENETDSIIEPINVAVWGLILPANEYVTHNC